MTLKELSQLYYLNREIEADKERLAKLEALAESPPCPALTGMPRGSRFESRLERYAAEIVDMKATIQEKISRCMREQKHLERYIAQIPDSLTRQIFTLRFVNGLSWLQVALGIGGNNTEASVKKVCYRYLYYRL